MLPIGTGLLSVVIAAQAAINSQAAHQAGQRNEVTARDLLIGYAIAGAIVFAALAAGFGLAHLTLE